MGFCKLANLDTTVNRVSHGTLIGSESHGLLHASRVIAFGELVYSY